jgi:hypothetical protein
MTRRLCNAIFTLTVFDIICTYVGIQTGLVIEANPIMAWAFSISPLFTAVTAVIVMYLVTRWVATKSYKWLNPALWVVVGIKACVAIAHIYWLTRV